MVKLYDSVILPEDTKRLLSKISNISNADKYAKLLLINKATWEELELIRKSLTQEEVHKIEALIEGIVPSISLNSIEKKCNEEIPDFFTVREVSQLTGLTPQQVRRNCSSKKFEATQVAGENSSWRIKPDQFQNLPNWEAFLQQRKEKFQKNSKAAKLGLNLWKKQMNVTKVDSQN